MHNMRRWRALGVEGQLKMSDDPVDNLRLFDKRTDDVDLNKKLKVWEDFCNYHQPHGSTKGKTPYEVLKEKLSAGQNSSQVV